jgi:hypothetical protein
MHFGTGQFKFRICSLNLAFLLPRLISARQSFRVAIQPSKPLGAFFSAVTDPIAAKFARFVLGGHSEHVSTFDQQKISVPGGLLRICYGARNSRHNSH